MSKILYIHPSKYMDESKYAYIPMGVFSIMSVLKTNGFDIKLINYPMECKKNTNFNIINKIEQFSPKYILIDLHWYEHSFGTIELAKIIKENFKSIKIIVGGLTASIFSNQILKFCEEIDYIVCGDGDYTTYHLVKSLDKNLNINTIPGIYYRYLNNVVHTEFKKKCVNINHLDYLSSIEYLEGYNDYFKMDIHGGVNQKKNGKIWLQVAKGCVFNCKYCGGSKKVQNEVFSREKIQIKNMENISNEIEILCDKYNIQQLMLSHDISNFGFKYVREFMNIVKKHDLGIYLEFFQIPSIKSLNYILKNSNIEKSLFAITPLVGDEKIRRNYGKVFDNKRLMNVLRILNDNNCDVDMYFTPNFEEESFNDFNRTIYLINDIKEKYRCKIFMQPITLEPKSELEVESGIKLKFIEYYEYCKNKNRRELRQMNLDKNYYKKMILWNMFKQKSGGEINGYY